MDEFKKKLKESPGIRFFIYVAALLICTLIGGVVAYDGVGNDINRLKIGQAISSLLIFAGPPLILYAITRKQPLRSLGFRKPNTGWMFLVGLVLMFISLPVTNQLGTWNENMNFGGLFQKMEEILKGLENTASDITQQMLAVDTFGGLLVNLLVIALIPAIGEELTFRGVLQQSLVRGCKNHNMGIILTAAIFSFIHFQFYGFLPRMFLGIILGYLFYYSGSLWVSILMHFINNGTAVLIAYLQHKGIVDVDYEHFGSTSSVWLVVLSLVLTVGLIILCNKMSKKYGRE